LERGSLFIWCRIGPWGQGLLSVRHLGQALVLGLPCRLVYATLVWSLATAGPLRGGALMAAFGIGTLPMLLALGSVADELIALTRRPRVR
jgi:sulfite exporter TauE/SafE